MRAGAAALLAGLALCCADPAYAPRRRALEAYDEGRAALEAGDAAAARLAFSRARGHDPGSPALLLWEARAADAAGDVRAAEALVTEGLHRWPDHTELRWTHAALLARGGRAAEAAAVLRALLAQGLVDPLDLSADADFAALRVDPATAGLFAAAAPQVDLVAEEGAVLVGDPWELELRVVGPAGPVALRGTPPPPGLELERVVEELLVDGRRVRRVLRFAWRAVAPMDAPWGPVAVHVGDAAPVPLPVLPVLVRAVGGRVAAGAPVAAPDLPPVPSSLAGPEGVVAGARRIGAFALVIAPPGARIELDGAPPGAELELRVAGQTAWVGRWWSGRPGGRFRVLQGEAVLAEGPLP